MAKKMKKYISRKEFDEWWNKKKQYMFCYTSTDLVNDIFKSFNLIKKAGKK